MSTTVREMAYQILTQHLSFLLRKERPDLPLLQRVRVHRPDVDVWIVD